MGVFASCLKQHPASLDESHLRELVGRKLKANPLTLSRLSPHPTPFKPEWVLLLYCLLDDNLDGKISVEELVNAIQIALHGDYVRKAEWLFVLCDVDSDGWISRVDLFSTLRYCCNASVKQRQLIQHDEFERLFGEIDKDEDGLVSPAEFVNSARDGGPCRIIIDLLLEKDGRIMSAILKAIE